ncbi:hypothetical protein GGR21_004086 [Dysgonomonas hofstadii]|uniref:DUF1062 domain-containing protein n=1 Tax=Dysgonomonas hofstadii TaxID=637886 RepID=A0A840CPY5_9BACT|nr:DUF1062 domain-containing protein [Dysgonomonas hofstadii]MBB4038157.1 hypothetical protein [Dysgonomonas hofstadii]
MSAIKEISWEILPLEAPIYIKRCSKCKNNNRFYNSSKFRMNNQKKNSDVWLIYKCIECDNTFNITILSRIKWHLIDKNLFDKFIDNDYDTALRLSLDQEIIYKNHIQIDYDSIEYEIRADSDMLFEDMVFLDKEEVRISIKYPYNLNLKLSRVIREKLNLSLNKLELMIDSGIICIDPMENIKKERIKDNTILTIKNRMLTADMFDK